jgi:hypothetical protein
MPLNPEPVISGELESGESLLWSGAPRQGLVFRGSDIVMIPLSIIWGGFFVVWGVLATRTGAPGIIWLWAAPFAVIGLFLIFGRFILDATLRSRTYYGLTDRRAIIVSGVLYRHVTSLKLSTLSEVSVMERRNGFGTIFFGHVPPWPQGHTLPGTSAFRSACFELIPDPKRVYNQIREVQDRK